MKLSQLKQIIKEEINELGFDYPGKSTDTPSPYQNGIMDTLKAIQQLGVNIDVNAVMDIIYPDDESPKDENPINENYVLDAMGTVLVGGVGLVLATAGVVGGTALALDNIQYGPIGDTIKKLKNNPELTWVRAVVSTGACALLGTGLCAEIADRGQAALHIGQSSEKGLTITGECLIMRGFCLGEIPAVLVA
jgi:hypothetical protein